MSEWRRADYWQRLELSQQTVCQAVREIEGEDDWSIHAIILSGESDDAVFGCCIRSKVGDSGLLLSERMIMIPTDIDDPDSIKMLDNKITRRVSGPIAQALCRGYARASNDRLAGNELSDPLLLDAIGEDVSDDPALLSDPIAEDPEQELRETKRKQQMHECTLCGELGDPDEMSNIAAALGEDLYVHDHCESDADE